jgi:two-component system sensor histidine kinase RegB
MQAREAINLSWLIRLRWGAVAGQAIIILLVDRVAAIDLPLLALFGILAVALASNIVAVGRLRRGTAIGESAAGGLMLLDVLLLTGLLYLTGGPLNPFSFLYLVNIVLAAVVLRPARAWTLAVVSLACFAGLFVAHRPLPLGTGGAHDHAHGDGMLIHLRGMWVAFGVAATFIVYFIQRVTRALAARDAELADERARRAREERLASLATLAAGAAHELATPLSTIAVAARELERELARTGAGDTVDDARLIRAQVERCRDILDQLSADAGGSTGEAARAIAPAALVAEALGGITDPAQITVEIDDAVRSRVLHVPARALARALRSVVRNATEASAAGTSSAGTGTSSPQSPVTVRVGGDADRLRIEVRDRGHGMTPEILARAAEPFFTTKNGSAAPGGMGLGLFLTRAIVEQLGGELVLASEPGTGTCVTLHVPLARNAPDPGTPPR